jgi:hypothetical protein
MEVNMTRRQMTTAAVLGATFLGGVVLVGIADHFSVLRDDDDDDDEEGGIAAVRQVLRYTRVSLQQGLTAGEEIGQPISGKFEVENRKFQLSVYTSKDNKFFEVLVDLMSGKVATVEPLTKRDDLANAKSQGAVMAGAKTSLKEAVDRASSEAAGFRAVGVIPNLKEGHPVASVLLFKGDQSQIVNVTLD